MSRTMMLVADVEHFKDRTNVSRKFRGITLKAVENRTYLSLSAGGGNQAFLGQNRPEFTDVYALACAMAYSGTRIFAHTLHRVAVTPDEFERCVFSGRVEFSRRSIVVFAADSDFVSVDVVGYYPQDPPQGWSIGRMQAFDRAGNLLESVETAHLKRGQLGTLACRRPTADLAYLVLHGPDGYGHEDFGVYIDNFRYHVPVPRLP